MVIAELAGGQHGVVSRRQLLSAGVGPEAIRQRMAVRRLRRVHRGVYAIGHRLPLEGVFMAAVLACGDGAVLSHGAAAALQDLVRTPSGPVDVTVPRAGGRRRPGIAIHSSRAVREAAVRRGIPCTTWARTIVDLAAVLERRRLERALEQSQILRVFDLRALQAELVAAAGKKGPATLRAVLGDLGEEPPPPRSELERLFLEVMAAARLPPPVVNAQVGGYGVDFHWPEHRLIVETDGRATHDTAIAFERDRRRDLDLELAGWHVLRVGWRQLRERPERVAGALRARIASPEWSSQAST